MSRRDLPVSFALAERQAREQRPPTGGAPSRGTAGRAVREPRHCWVRDPAYPMKLPGIVLRWAQVPLGWEALVVYAVPEPEGLVQRWLPDDALEPA